jgi:hypothetical protein
MRQTSSELPIIGLDCVNDCSIRFSLLQCSPRSGRPSLHSAVTAGISAVKRAPAESDTT